jgi:hypothetical protein
MGGEERRGERRVRRSVGYVCFNAMMSRILA